MHLYGSFDERGYTFQAYAPDNDHDRVAFELRILIGDAIKHTLLVPLTYVPVFGVDVDDLRFLESVADRVLRLLPAPETFCADTVVALEDLETEIGGKRVRARAATTSPQSTGDFEYTAGLFAARFADILGSQEAVRAWMKVPLEQLQNRTPEEALRQGLAPEVLKSLFDLAERKARERAED